MREQSHAGDKMENELEMQKENKQHVDSADQVAGRYVQQAAARRLRTSTPRDHNAWGAVVSLRRVDSTHRGDMRLEGWLAESTNHDVPCSRLAVRKA